MAPVKKRGRAKTKKPQTPPKVVTLEDSVDMFEEAEKKEEQAKVVSFVPNILGSSRSVLTPNKQLRLEDLPPLVNLDDPDHLRVQYITRNVVHQEFELRLREKLFRFKRKVEDSIRAIDREVKLAIMSIPASMMNVPMSQILAATGNPKSFPELIQRLMAGEVNVPKSTSEDHNGGMITPARSIASSHFPGTSKAPRVPKPGEVMFSSNGSPIKVTNFPMFQAQQSKPKHRIELFDGSGKIEVDLVLSNPDAEKNHVWRDFLTDVRGIANAKTTIQQKRMVARFPTSAKSTRKAAGKSNKPWH